MKCKHFDTHLAEYLWVHSCAFSQLGRYEEDRLGQIYTRPIPKFSLDRQLQIGCAQPSKASPSKGKWRGTALQRISMANEFRPQSRRKGEVGWFGLAEGEGKRQTERHGLRQRERHRQRQRQTWTTAKKLHSCTLAPALLIHEFRPQLRVKASSRDPQTISTAVAEERDSTK